MVQDKYPGPAFIGMYIPATGPDDGPLSNQKETAKYDYNGNPEPGAGQNNLYI